MSDEVAKILAQALDSVWQGNSTPAEWVEKYPQYGEELKAMLDIAVQMQSLQLPEPDQEFRTHSRMRILRYISLKQSAGTKAVVSRPVRRKPSRRDIPMFRRTALSFAMVVTLLLALMTTGTVYASADSIPGDTLYPVKTAFEDVRLAVSNDQQDARLYVRFAEERVEEIELLLIRGRVELIPIAIARYEIQVQKAVEILPTLAETLPPEEQSLLQEQFTQNKETLTRVMQQVPQPAKPNIKHAIDVSDKEQEKLKEILPLQPKGKPTEPPGVVPQEKPTRQPTKTPRASNTPEPKQVPKDTKAPPGKETSPPNGAQAEPTRDKPTREMPDNANKP